MAIVRSTIGLAHSLGLAMVAEGVEDEQTSQALTSFGCDFEQGFLHSRPLPATILEAWIDGRTRPDDAGSLPVARPESEQERFRRPSR